MYCIYVYVHVHKCAYFFREFVPPVGFPQLISLRVRDTVGRREVHLHILIVIMIVFICVDRKRLTRRENESMCVNFQKIVEIGTINDLRPDKLVFSKWAASLGSIPSFTLIVTCSGAAGSLIATPSQTRQRVKKSPSRCSLLLGSCWFK